MCKVFKIVVPFIFGVLFYTLNVNAQNIATDSISELVHSEVFQTFSSKQKAATIKELIDLNWQISPKLNILLGEQLLEICKKEDLQKDEAFAYKAMGRAYYQSSYFQQALLNFQKCALLSHKIGYSEGESAADYNIGLIFIARNEYEKAEIYIKKALNIDVATQNLEGQAACYNSLGVIYMHQKNNSDALAYFDKAKNKAEECNALIEISNAYFNTGNIYKQQGSYSLAFSQFEQSLSTSKECNYLQGIANADFEMGLLFEVQGHESEALEYFLKSLSINDNLGYKKGMSQNLNSIGNIYKNQGEYQKALDNFFEALAIEKQIKNKEGKAILLNNIGTTYVLQKNYVLALNFFNQSLEINKETGNKNGLATTFESIGILYVKQLNYNLALQYYSDALTLRESNNDNAGFANISYNMALLYLKMGQTKQAIEYLDKSKNIALESGLLNLLLNCYSGYTDVYSANKDFQKSLYYYDLYTHLKDSIYTREDDIRIAELETKFETEKKERRIEQQKFELTHTQLALNKKKMQVVFFSFVFVLILIFISYLIVTQRKLKLKNLKLHLLGSFKEDLTNMIVHDLKSPLSSIVNIRLIKDDNTRINMVEQSGYRMLNLVQNILDVYKYENTQLQIEKQAFSISELITSAYDEVKFHGQSKMLEFQNQVQSKFICYADENIIRRVLVNLFSNAVKFSPQGGKITIKPMQLDNDKLKIQIFNQGSEIPANKQEFIFKRFAQAEVRQENNTRSTGLGLTFCKIAIDAHHEEIGVNSEVNSEVEFWFTLPYEKDESLMNIISQPVSNKKEAKGMGSLNELLTLKTFEILKIEQKVNELVNAESISSDIGKSILELAYSGDNNLYQQFIKKITNS